MTSPVDFAARSGGETGNEGLITDHATHVLVDDDWAVWRIFQFRPTGLSFELMLPLTHEPWARALDEGCDDGVQREAFGRGLKSSIEHIRDLLAAEPRYLEALAWQNPAFARIVQGLSSEKLTSKPRQRLETAVGYLQRYTCKADTIAFVGPVAWGGLLAEAEAPVRTIGDPATIERRTVYFEDWAAEAIREVLESHDDVRPALPLAVAPTIWVGETEIWLPRGQREPMDPSTRVVLSLCDGTRKRNQVRSEAMWYGAAADGGVIDALLDDLIARSIVLVGVPPPVASTPMARLLERLRALPPEPGNGVDRAAEVVQEMLDVARTVEHAHGPARTAEGLQQCAQIFSKRSGRAATRRPGEMFAGRTPVYLDCLSDLYVELDEAILRTSWPALRAVLDSAMWVCGEVAHGLTEALTEAHERISCRSGIAEVPVADLQLVAFDHLYGADTIVYRQFERLRRLWAEIFDVHGTHETVQLAPADVAERAQARFQHHRPTWPLARYQSLDLMIDAQDEKAIRDGEYRLVLGELHTGMNTLENRLAVDQHPDPQRLRLTQNNDGIRGRIVPNLPRTWPGLTSRATPPTALPGTATRFLNFSDQVASLEPSLPVGALAVRREDGLRVVGPSLDHPVDLIDLLAEFISLAVVTGFDLTPPGDYVPRISAGRLVLSRQTWRVDTTTIDGLSSSDLDARAATLREWCRGRGLPRHVFYQSAADAKPVFVDFDSPVLVHNMARSFVRSLKSPRHDATITEMLPGPDGLWLRDRHSRRYVSELRLVAVARS